MQIMEIETARTNNGRGRTLLIVEDDAAMREMCVSLFEREGYRAEGVSSADEALARVKSDGAVERAAVDLVLSDVKLGR